MKGYKSKLLEVHSAYKRAKAKAEALWQQMQQLELDKKELQSKYEQKSGEKRRIEASYHRELQTRAEWREVEEEEGRQPPARPSFPMPPPSPPRLPAHEQPAYAPRQPTLGPQHLPPRVPAVHGQLRRRQPPPALGLPPGGSLRGADPRADPTHLPLLGRPDEPAAGLPGRQARVAQGRGRGREPRRAQGFERGTARRTRPPARTTRSPSETERNETERRNRRDETRSVQARESVCVRERLRRRACEGRNVLD